MWELILELHKKGSSSTTVQSYQPTAEERKLMGLSADYAEYVMPNAQKLNDSAANMFFESLGDTQVDYTALLEQAQQQTAAAQQGISDLTQGKLPDSYTQNMTDAIASGVENTMGSALDSLASRGVLSSSVTTQAMNDISKNISDTMAQQYQNNIGILNGLYGQQASLAGSNISLSAAAQEAILLDANTRLQSAPIQDGRVYWVEDITKINRIREQLAEINAQLSEENELIQAENALKRQRAQIEEKNRLMDAMTGLVQPQLQQINRLLEDGGAKNLKSVCLLGAYVKRRVNLALICEKKAIVPVEELTHCIRESLTYLTQYGAVCALHQEGSGSVDSRAAQLAYDYFEDCLEAALPSLTALMARVECGERFSIRLMMEDAAGLPDADKYARLGQITTDNADGELCVTLSFSQGGECL